MLLRGEVAGVGLSYGDHLVHLAAFPTPSCGWCVRVKIHRGAHEIGGSCVEVEANGWRWCLTSATARRPRGAKHRPASSSRLRVADPLLGVIITHATRTTGGWQVRYRRHPSYMGRRRTGSWPRLTSGRRGSRSNRPDFSRTEYLRPGPVPDHSVPK